MPFCIINNMFRRLFCRPDKVMLRPGTVLADRYLIVERMARTGSSEVYAAEDRYRRVAIKVLLEKRGDTFTEASERRARFRKEAEMLKSVKHPGVVRAFDFGHSGNGMPFIVMEHVAGAELETLLGSGPLAFECAKPMLLQLCDALAAVHAARILHRDVRPRNILVGNRTKLIDFGIAAPLAEVLEETPSCGRQIYVGTPAYLSPEQINGSAVDHRADIYALGITMYRMLGGAEPFESEDLRELLLMHCITVPQPLRSINPTTPKSVEGLVMRALEKDPAKRFQSAQEIRAAIAAIG